MQNWLYQGLSASAVAGSSTTAEMRARISSILAKSAAWTSAAASAPTDRGPAAATTDSRRQTSVHRSLTRSSSSAMPVTIAVKLSRRRFCQPCGCEVNQETSVGLLLRSSTEDGVRWKT